MAEGRGGGGGRESGGAGRLGNPISYNRTFFIKFTQKTNVIQQSILYLVYSED